MKDFNREFKRVLDEKGGRVDVWDGVAGRAYTKPKTRPAVWVGRGVAAAACLLLVAATGLSVSSGLKPITRKPGERTTELNNQLFTNEEREYKEKIISDSLANQLEEIEDDNQPVRVEVSYQDEEILNNVTVDGLTVLQLYRRISDVYLEYALKQAVASAYYGYLFSWQEEPYALFSDSWLSQAYPEILASRDAFEQYIRQDEWLMSIPFIDRAMSGRPYSEIEKNQESEWDVLYREILTQYYIESLNGDDRRLADIGEKISQESIRKAARQYNLKDVQYDRETLRYSDRFTVTMTKKEILTLAEQEGCPFRFWSLGVEKAASRPDRISNELALMLPGIKEGEQVEVNVVYHDSERYGCYPYLMIRSSREKMAYQYGEGNNLVSLNVSGLPRDYIRKYLWPDYEEWGGWQWEIWFRYDQFTGIEKQMTRREIEDLAMDETIRYMDIVPNADEALLVME